MRARHRPGLPPSQPGIPEILIPNGPEHQPFRPCEHHWRPAGAAHRGPAMLTVSLQDPRPALLGAPQPTTISHVPCAGRLTVVTGISRDRRERREAHDSTGSPRPARRLAADTGKKAPPAGPRAPGWTRPAQRPPRRTRPGSGKRPSRPRRPGQSRAHRPPPVQVVRPAGRSTWTGSGRRAPLRVADGDGMDHPPGASAPVPERPRGNAPGKGRKDSAGNREKARRSWW